MWGSSEHDTSQATKPVCKTPIHTTIHRNGCTVDPSLVSISMGSVQVSSTLCKIPDEIRNRIYELWAFDLVGAGMGSSRDDTGEASLLGTRCCLITCSTFAYCWYLTIQIEECISVDCFRRQTVKMTPRSASPMVRYWNHLHSIAYICFVL